MYTQENAREDLEEARCIIYQAGMHDIDENFYTIKVNSHSTRYLGLCHKNAYRDYTITINQHYAEIASHDEIINTWVHELLHSLPNCMNHKAPWQSAANKIYAYNGMRITRIAENTESVKQYCKERTELKVAKTPTYEIWCNDCNRCIAKYHRKVSTVNRIITYKEKSGICHNSCRSCNLSVKIINPTQF